MISEVIAVSPDADAKARTLFGNDLLAALSSHDDGAFSLLRPDLEPVKLNLGMILQGSGAPITHVYFPSSGLISCAVALEDDREITTHIIGRDGGVNIDLECGRERMNCKCVVELPGYALRLKSEAWRAALAQSSKLRGEIARHFYAQVLQAQRMVACNIAHDAESRLCRWLLRLHDYSDRGTIPVTHQSLARLMSVRRTTVTLAARALHDAGIIHYRRGQIEILDRFALEPAACACFRTAVATAFQAI